MAKIIPLTQGRYATVSDEDYEPLMVYNWYAFFNGLKWYAAAKINRKNVYMHRFVMNPPQNMDVDHINGDGLCNARYNLRIVTRSDNLLNKLRGNLNKKRVPYNYHPEPVLHDKTRIHLIGGGWTLIDEDDWDRLYPFRWHIHSRKDGYKKVVRGTGLRMIYMSREILGVADPKIIVDHINGDTLDNRKANLRLVNRQQNAFNAKHNRSNNSSGYKGVTYFASRGKWVAQITHNYKHVTIGYFDTAEEAAMAYDKKAIELFGEYARTNFRHT